MWARNLNRYLTNGECSDSKQVNEKNVSIICYKEIKTKEKILCSHQQSQHPRTNDVGEGGNSSSFSSLLV